MSTGIDQLCRTMADYLESRGVAAVTAWPMVPRREGGPVAVVSLRGCRAECSGFQDYLGERFNEDTGLWEEVFGKKTELTFGLDLYAGEREDGQKVHEAFDKLAQALILGGPRACGWRSSPAVPRPMTGRAGGLCGRLRRCVPDT